VCGEIDELIGDLYAVEPLVPGRLPDNAAAPDLRYELRQALIAYWIIDRSP
jgi:hypothetical protein